MIGCSNVFLQLVRGNLGIAVDRNNARFIDIQQATQTVAGNSATEMIFQGIRLHVFFTFRVRIVIGAGGDSIGRAHMNPVSGDFRTACHRGIGVGVNGVVHTGAPHADNATMTFGSRETSHILLGSHEIYFPLDIPYAPKSAVYRIG